MIFCYNISMQSKPTSAYVHVPFCTQICFYCDFSKVFIKNQPVDDYLVHLMQEVDSYDIRTLRTLYIGGGTPTALSAKQLDFLLQELDKRLDLSQIEEFTIEANPGDLTAEKVEVLAASKVNRVSLGVQTFDDLMLKKIGRSHTVKDIYDNIDRLKQAGFHNISIDLIYALPGQTIDQVKENVARAIGLDIPHMSLYSLILENHTVFMNRMRRGIISCIGTMRNTMVWELGLLAMLMAFVIATMGRFAIISRQLKRAMRAFMRKF